MVGNSLGPYEIVEPLGKGSMGEVYLAEDTRLGRRVAIKILPVELAADPERLSRFEQEARAAAALNHPHIAAVFDVGAERSEDGSGTVHFIVQEHLEGQSLRERLERGRIPPDRALKLAIEVGEALAAAHRAGIVHRDLKPDNIFVTDEGHAKVLDFGLAKLTEPAAPPSPGTGASRSPTVLGTDAGQIMGTAGYMAPEQVNGETVDHRADLFAFGCVLYEMLAGRRAFSGERPVDILHAVVRAEPRPLAEIDDGLPPDLYRIVGKCLAKDPARRYQATGDLVVDLRALPTAADAADTTPVTSRPPEPSRRIGLGQALALVVLGALLGTVATAAWLWRGADPRQPARIFQIDSYADLSNPQVAPDGHAVAYVRDGRLVVRNLARLEAEELEGTDGASRPFWSPDSASIGYFVERPHCHPTAAGWPTSRGRAVSPRST